jgi:hypothetical protein
MDYLAVLLVQAVETVDRRREAVAQPARAPTSCAPRSPDGNE